MGSQYDRVRRGADPVDAAGRAVDRLVRRVERTLTEPLSAGPPESDDTPFPALDHAGVELVETIGCRADGRGVHLVRHPMHGLCMLKTSRTAPFHLAGLANLQIARVAMASQAPIFPRVFDATASYTLEEHIPGPALRPWIESDDFRPDVLERFLVDLRDWGTSAEPWIGPPDLSAGEIRTIAGAYLRKCIGQAGYFGTARRAGILRRLLSERRDLAADIEALAAEAETLRMPRGRMCGDMSNVNLVHDARRDRVLNIDYESLGIGHTGFDCVYLLTSLAKFPHDPRDPPVVSDLVGSAAYLGSPELARWFTRLARVLVTVSRILHEKAPPKG